MILLGLVIRTGLEIQRGWLLLDFGKNKITGKQVDTFWQEADEETKQFVKDITIYQKLEKKSIQSELEKNSRVLVYRVYGNMEHLQGDRLVCGTFVQSEDRKGCVIGKKLAQSLFHTENAEGEILKMGKQSLYVRGVLKREKNVCLIRGEKEQVYRYLWVHYEEMAGEEVKEKLETAMAGSATIKWEGDLYAILGNVICAMLWGSAWSMLLIKCKKTYSGKLENGIRKDAVDILWTIFLIGGLLLIIGLEIKPTDDYLPNEWSDFAFWSRLFAEKSAELISQVFR